jgi:hypothetical protein
MVWHVPLRLCQTLKSAGDLSRWCNGVKTIVPVEVVSEYMVFIVKAYLLDP